MIRVMLVDDHAVVRAGYRRLLELHDDMRVLAEASDGAQALERLKDDDIDVAVIDLGLPGLGGLELIARLRQRPLHTRVLAFSMHRDPASATQALRAGALGYVTKSSPPELLVQGVRQVSCGQRLLSPDVAGEVAALLLTPDELSAHHLTPREFEVLRALVDGRSVQQIAESLSLSVKTVHNLHYQIKAKLGTGSDFELARLAWQKGWIT